MNARQHWEQIYRTKRPAEVSWYAPHLNLSLRLIEEAAPNRDAAIIDVGGGEATLVDDLLNLGYRRLSVLDVSATALDVAKNRLDEAQRARRGSLRSGRAARRIRAGLRIDEARDGASPDAGRSHSAIHVLLLQDFRCHLNGRAIPSRSPSKSAILRPGKRLSAACKKRAPRDPVNNFKLTRLPRVGVVARRC